MRRLQDVVRLSPASVTKISVTEAERAASRARHPSVRTPRVAEVLPFVDPRVWGVALRLAGGMVDRIEVRSSTEVVVR